MRGVGSGTRAVGRLGGAKTWMPHTLGHSEAPEEVAVRCTGGAGQNPDPDPDPDLHLDLRSSWRAPIGSGMDAGGGGDAVGACGACGARFRGPRDIAASSWSSDERAR